MSKKISIKDLRNAVKEARNSNPEVATIEWNGLSIEIKKYITLDALRAAVSSIVGASFDDDGIYQPSNTEPAIRFAVIGLYTNLSMFSDVGENYDLVYKTDLYRTVCNNIDKAQFEHLVEAVYAQIDEIIKVRSNSVLSKVNEVYEMTANMQQQFEEIFRNVDSDGLNKLIGAVNENRGLDEKKLVQAIMEVKNGNDAE